MLNVLLITMVMLTQYDELYQLNKQLYEIEMQEYRAIDQCVTKYFDINERNNCIEMVKILFDVQKRLIYDRIQEEKHKKG